MLVNLAYHANEATGNAYPSIEVIRRETELDRKTVIEALKRLVEDGWIAETGRFVGKTQQIKVYHFSHVVTVPKTEPLDGQRVEKQSGNGPEAIPLPVEKQSRYQSQKRDTESGTGNQEQEPEQEGGESPNFEKTFQEWEGKLSKMYPKELIAILEQLRRDKQEAVSDEHRKLVIRKIKAVKSKLYGPDASKENESDSGWDPRNPLIWNPRNEGQATNPAKQGQEIAAKVAEDQAIRATSSPFTEMVQEVNGQTERQVTPADWENLKASLK